MTEVGEMAGVGLAPPHQEGECPFCKEKPEEETRENDLSRDNNKLRGSLGEVPEWKARIPGGETYDLQPDAHHLIPITSMDKAASLRQPWVEGSETAGPIGYDINDENNGVWLPSTRPISSSAPWKSNSPGVKKAFVEAAMTAARQQIHSGGHPQYNDYVQAKLNGIGDALAAVRSTSGACPLEDEDGKPPPLYALVERLHGVADGLRPFLAATRRPHYALFTSNLVPLHWWLPTR